jgi:hypothetical protein
MDDVEREYDYKPKWWVFLLTLGYFALGAVASGYMASSNPPDIMRVFYWVIGGLCLGLAALVGVRAVERLFLPRRVALTPTCLLLATRLGSTEEVAIEYGAITGLFLSAGDYAPWSCRVAIDYQATSGLPTRKVQRARWLYVTYPGGKRRIAAAELLSQAAFEEVCDLLRTRVRSAQQPGRAEQSAAADQPPE